MRSSSGQHFIALDHLRAYAAFMVVTWHFLHFNNGSPVPFEGVPAFLPFALLDEGHTGVSLFMTLSGYLFAKLLNGRSIRYSAFYWNRFIRLAPLLFICFAMVGLQRHLNGGSLIDFLLTLYRGFIYPVWPNGGWSIATELHFYAALPLLIYLSHKSRIYLLLIIIFAIAFRTYYYSNNDQVQTIAYWTILGRIDQFTMGLFAFLCANKIINYRRTLLAILVIFCVLWWVFDLAGGFYELPAYPSSSPIWITIPTIEGISYAALIIWYESLNIDYSSATSRALQKLGEYSYSIYLLHFFVVFKAASFIDSHITTISNIYIGIAWSAVFMVLMMIPGYFSHKYIESPFLRLRVPYIRTTKQT